MESLNFSMTNGLGLITTLDFKDDPADVCNAS
jgi:hypothetical protein